MSHSDDTDVLSLWESFPEWIKGATLFIILTYLATFMAANYWSLPEETATLLVYWPFAVIIWGALVWFGFSLIVTIGVWIGGRFAREERMDIVNRGKKVILFIPIIIGSVLSVSVVFMSDIFRKTKE